MLSVSCFKQDYSLPIKDQESCEVLYEPRNNFEDCQRKCSDKIDDITREQCLQFTFFKKQDDFGEIVTKCCFHYKHSSNYSYELGTISGPRRCGIYSQFYKIYIYVIRLFSNRSLILNNDATIFIT